MALYEYQYEVGTTTLSFVLTAQSNLASAEQSYYTSLVNYAEAIMDLNFRKGTLLDYHNVTLAESDWTPEAYKDAVRNAWARSHAIPANFKCTIPEENQLPSGVETLLPSSSQPTTGAGEPVPRRPAASRLPRRRRQLNKRNLFAGPLRRPCRVGLAGGDRLHRLRLP